MFVSRFLYVVLRLVRRFCPAPVANFVFSRYTYRESRFLNQLKTYLEQLSNQQIELKNRRIVEIGAGKYNPSSLGLLAFEVEKVILIEPFAASIDVAKYRMYVQRFFEAVDRHFGKVVPVDMVMSNSGFHTDKAEFLQCFGDKTPCLDNSIDIVVSHSVFEHIADVKTVLHEQIRILKPGGIVLHIIDLRDHLFRFPFHMLTFPRAAWEHWLTKSNSGSGFQNRLRANDYIALMISVGFERANYVTLRSDLSAYRDIRKYLDREFLGRDDAMMAAQVIALCGYKKV